MHTHTYIHTYCIIAARSPSPRSGGRRACAPAADNSTDNANAIIYTYSAYIYICYSSTYSIS